MTYKVEYPSILYAMLYFMILSLTSSWDFLLFSGSDLQLM